MIVTFDTKKVKMKQIPQPDGSKAFLLSYGKLKKIIKVSQCSLWVTAKPEELLNYEISKRTRELAIDYVYDKLRDLQCKAKRIS